MTPAEQKYVDNLISRIIQLENANAALTKELKTVNRHDKIIAQLTASLKHAQHLIRIYKQKYEGEQPDPVLFGIPASQMGTKQLALAIFGNQCFYCNVPLLKTARTFDHVVPRVYGGKDYRNLVPSCYQCNLDKGATLPPQALLDYIAAAHENNLLPPGNKPFYK